MALRRERASLGSLIGLRRGTLARDLRTCLWAIPVSVVLAVGANLVLRAAMYGSITSGPIQERMSLAGLPAWALIVSVAVFPIVNAFVEEMTYNGYGTARMAERLGAPWAIVIVTALFSVQHIAVPFAFDARFLLWRVLSFIPLLLFWVVLYLWQRRLPALIVTHALLDAFALATLIVLP